MAELITLARPYAKAAFDFANETSKVSDWQEYLVFSADVVQNEQFVQYLRTPSLTQQQKFEALLQVSDNSFSTDFANFLAQLAENERLELLPAIKAEYEVLKTESEKELKAHIESAYELSSDEIALLQSGLERRFGQNVQVVPSVNEELLAGVVIRIGDLVIDDSAIAKLKQLKTSLTA